MLGSDCRANFASPMPKTFLLIRRVLPLLLVLAITSDASASSSRRPQVTAPHASAVARAHPQRKHGTQRHPARHRKAQRQGKTPRKSTTATKGTTTTSVTTPTTTTSVTTATTTTQGSTQAVASPFFSPSSFWNEPLAADAPLDPNSAGMVSNLLTYVNAELGAKSGPWINVNHDGVAIVTVPANQPTVRVQLVNHSPDAALTSAWSAVPLPASAQPSSGDGDLAVWQPSTDRMWEFFVLSYQSGEWQAEWGGAMQNVSSNLGVYGPIAWPGAKTYWGVTATSFPIVGGVITYDDLAAGQINHALALSIPDTRAGWYVSPAERDDGVSTSADSIPEGARLRLDPSLNLARMDLPPMSRMIAQAAQRYGIVIRDTSPIIAFVGQDPTGNSSAQALYQQAYAGEWPFQLMAYFPWSHLQVLKMSLHQGT